MTEVCIFQLIKYIKICTMCCFIIVCENIVMNFIIIDNKSIYIFLYLCLHIKCYENNSYQPHWVTLNNDLLLGVPVPSWLIQNSIGKLTITSFLFYKFKLQVLTHFFSICGFGYTPRYSEFQKKGSNGLSIWKNKIYKN